MCIALGHSWREDKSTRTSQKKFSNILKRRSKKNANPEYHIIARLKDGVSIGSAAAELKVIQSVVAKEYTDQHAREGASSVILQTYGDSVVESSVREALFALLAASSVLWLIAVSAIVMFVNSREPPTLRFTSAQKRAGST